MAKAGRTSQIVAPEDIRLGDFVCLLRVVQEWIPFFDNAPWHRDPLRRVEMMPCDEQLPMRVVEVCLPFIMVKQTDGTHRVLDIRRHRLARVARIYGQSVFSRMKRERKKRPSERNLE